MRLERFTERAQEAILEAQERARGENHSQIEAEHLLLALLQQSNGLVPQIVRQLGSDPELLIRKVEEALGELPRAYGALRSSIFLPPYNSS